MLERFKAFITRVGAKLGIVKEINQITDHRKVYAEETTYDRIQLNKQIYNGFVPDWHNIRYATSNGISKQREMQRLNMGKVVAEEMATLIFNEKCQIDVATKGLKNTDEKSEVEINDPAKEYVTEVLKDNGFYKNFQRYLEYCYALGGMAIKVFEHEGKIKLSYAVADAMYPLSNDSENLDEMLFIYEEKKDDKYYTLLEWHEWGKEHNDKGELVDAYIITNELYESDRANKLGHKVSLNVLYENLKERTPITGVSRPLYVYFKPNTANNKEMQSPLGVSLFDNSHNTLYSIDYMYDFFLNEFKLGKRRIAVDHSMIKPYIDTDGNTHYGFDTDETVFVPLNSDDDVQVKDLSVDLRTNDIITAINSQLELLAMQTGFSSGAFTFDGKSVKTATEVVAENSKTYRTKNSHEVLVEQGIKDLVKTILEVATLHNLYSGNLEVDVTVDFDDSIAEDRQQVYNYYSMAAKDGLIPKKEAIQRIFKVTEKRAEEWLAEIDTANNSQLTGEMYDLLGVPARDMSNE